MTAFCVYFLMLFFFLSLPLSNTGSSEIYSDFILPNPTGFHFQIHFLVSHLVFMAPLCSSGYLAAF